MRGARGSWYFGSCATEAAILERKREGGVPLFCVPRQRRSSQPENVSDHITSIPRLYIYDAAVRCVRACVCVGYGCGVCLIYRGAGQGGPVTVISLALGVRVAFCCCGSAGFCCRSLFFLVLMVGAVNSHQSNDARSGGVLRNDAPGEPVGVQVSLGNRIGGF